MEPTGALNSYFPSMSVIVPVAVPLTSTFTPITGSPVLASKSDQRMKHSPNGKNLSASNKALMSARPNSRLNLNRVFKNTFKQLIS